MNKKDDIFLNNTKYNSVLIFCHGLGDHPSSWLFFGKELMKNFKNLKIIFLKAPESPVLINNNKIMASWFDITEFPITKNYIDNGKYINISLNNINNCIEKEIQNGISSDKIFIGGFSQGGALSLISGLNNNYKLGGIIIMSGWIFKNNNIRKNYNLKDIPIIIGHGDNDKTVLFENAENIKKVLNDNNYSNITLIRYSNMGHNSSSKEIYDIINWLKKLKL